MCYKDTPTYKRKRKFVHNFTNLFFDEKYSLCILLQNLNKIKSKPIV